MLKLESLIEEASSKGMPRHKLRGIAREYLQTLILKYLYRSHWQERFFFLGGTCLRLLYGLKRFSEDLDFNVKNLTKSEFEEIAKIIKKELSRENINCIVSYKHRDPLYIASFTFEEIQKIYKLNEKREKIVLKIEANLPNYEFPAAVHSIASFGEIFLVKTMAKEWIFADKIDTLRNKKLGRHLYDTIFMLSKKFGVSQELLRINGLIGHPKDIILEIVNSIPDAQLKKMAQQVAPFLFDEEQRDLIINAKIVIKNIVNYLDSI